MQKGLDPRDSRWSRSAAPGRCTAPRSRRMLGIPEVIVPPYPGITSAMGLLTTDLKYDTIRTQFQVSGTIDLDAAQRRSRRDGAPADARNSPPTISRRQAPFRARRRSALCRPGLRAENPVPARHSSRRRAVLGAFHQAHEREYGHSFDGTRSRSSTSASPASAAAEDPQLDRARRASLAAATVGNAHLRVFRVDGELTSSRRRSSRRATSAGRRNVSPGRRSCCRRQHDRHPAGLVRDHDRRGSADPHCRAGDAA